LLTASQCWGPKLKFGSGGSPGASVNRFGTACWGDVWLDIAACPGARTGATVGAWVGAWAGIPTGAALGAWAGRGAGAPGTATRNPLMIASVAGPSETACENAVVTDKDTRYLSDPEVAMT